MRLVWRIIGVGAAVLCALNALFLVGFSVSELVSPGSVESTGPSPWLVVTPWMLGLFVVARWSLRRAERTPPDALARRASRGSRALDGWAEAHPILYATIAGGVFGIPWFLMHGWLVGLGAAVAFAVTGWLAGRLRHLVRLRSATTRSAS